MNEHVYPARTKLEDRLVDLYNLDIHSIKLIDLPNAIFGLYKKKIKFDTVHIDDKKPLTQDQCGSNCTYILRYCMHDHLGYLWFNRRRFKSPMTSPNSIHRRRIGTHSRLAHFSSNQPSIPLIRTKKPIPSYLDDIFPRTLHTNSCIRFEQIHNCWSIPRHIYHNQTFPLPLYHRSACGG